MVTADAETRVPAEGAYLPWLQQRIEARSASPLAAGLAIAGAQLALFFAWHALGWALGIGSPRDPWFWEAMFGPNVINAALIGYAPAAMAWSRRQARDELAHLAPLLSPADAAAFAERAAGFPRFPMALAGAGFSLLILPIVLFDPYMRDAFERSNWIQASWLLWVNAVVGWLMTRAVLEELRLARLFSHAGERVISIDLFDLAPLEPFARRGVEAVLVWVVGASLLSLIFAGEGWASDSLPFLVGAILIVASFAFAWPLAGVHRRIRAAKRAELARLHAELRVESEALLARSSGSAEAAARLSALLALRAQVSDVREWPVDLPTVARLAGFLGIGLASWVGAALVDVAIEAALH